MIEDSIKKTTTRADILDGAKQCVCQDRDDQYGSPEDNFTTVAALWSAYLKAACLTGNSYAYLCPHDVAAMMALLKIARIATGKPKPDSWIDMAGYAACGGELQLRGSRDDSKRNVE